MTTLADVLRAGGFDATGIVAIRNALHPDDVSEDFRDTEAILRAGVLGMYDRMQDGPVIADGSRVLSFVAMDDARAKLTAFRVFKLRAGGNVPGDIVYDYDAAHLLHAFIARAAKPTFYDAVDIDGFDDLIGRLVVRWPEPMAKNIICANDAALAIVSI